MYEKKKKTSWQLFQASCLWKANSLMRRDLRATLDKGPETKNPGTNLKQIEPWIGPLFTLKKSAFFLR
jgi:hypothetical protein